MNDALKDAMSRLGEKPDTLFLGQAVGCAGTKMSSSFDGVPADKRLEFPVAEQLQLGVSIGLALEGFVPVSVFPRWNFLLSATDALVNHLDRLPLYSDYRPRVIVRTAVGSRVPLDPGPQHDGDFTDAFRLMLKTVRVKDLRTAADAGPAYRVAYESGGAHLLVEHPEV